MALDPEALEVTVISSNMLYFLPAATVKDSQDVGSDEKSAHSFRHFFCTDLLRRGVALHEAKALMRHRDVRSTMVYSHATVDDLRAAVNRRLG